jgi:heme/copper-type cytochrome/quinol oxidase subunit 4
VALVFLHAPRPASGWSQRTASAPDLASMNKWAINISYAQSLAWVAFCMALISAESNLVELLFVDFVHGNPHRTQENAIFMMTTYSPLFGVITIIGTYLVFTLPQLFQAGLIGNFERMFGDRARFAPLLALPLTTVLTWYCYDYFTPSNLCFAGSCMDYYEHGLSVPRYLMALLAQMPITLFCFLYFEAGFRGRSKTPIILAALSIALVAGGIRGYVLARGQYQFL